ncbi:MAG: hypothetical protein ACRDWH_04420 [Acidimicrobiia bacterium]
MPRYLVVAHQTADSPELVAALSDITKRHPDAVFVLVVPSTPPSHLVTWTEGEAKTIALAAGERAMDSLRRHGIALESIRVGDQDPVNAACDEWNDHPHYDEVILSTFSVGASRWLKGDAYKRLTKRISVPVTHIVAESS